MKVGGGGGGGCPTKISATVCARGPLAVYASVCSANIKKEFNDLVSCTSLGGIRIRMLFLGFCNPSEYIYNYHRAVGSIPTRGPCAASQSSLVRS
jgi:hypothetical protein